MTLEKIIQNRRVIITCGTGGVGKTTLSAALGLRAAQLGRNVVVVTIDPAKRLATALGVTHLGDDPTDLTPSIEKSLGTPLAGKFFAVMPDTRRTFENFIRSISNEPQFHNRVAGNPIFQILSKEFSGANEYMALQKLDSVRQDPRFDLIILDTPPSRNMVAFLTTPKVITQLFEERFIRWLVLPANKLVSAGMKKAYEILEKLTGANFVSHLMEFATLLTEVQEPFLARVNRVADLMASKEVGFVLVTAAQTDSLPEFEHLIKTVDEKGFELDALFVNRTLQYLSNTKPSPRSDDTHLNKAMDLFTGLAHREARILKQMEDVLSHYRKDHPDIQFLLMPQLVRDIHSLGDLSYVAQKMV